MQATLRQREIEKDEHRVRLRVTIRGAVQGVGFRPFVYRLACELQLTGSVNNTSQGVFIEVEGNTPQVESFLSRLEKEKPPRAFIQSSESSFLDPIGYAAFEIRESAESGEKTALVLPDIATCPDCLQEIFDPTNRRYRYPFTNCTNCGPRFTIITALPYDRCNTTMKNFAMCPACVAEYHDPVNRRFHAQPNACPTCGPQVELWDHEGLPLAIKDDAIFEAVDAITRGKIVAVKGLGGFHLLVAASNEKAVQRLRQRKHREEKPFALMYPNLELLKSHCEASKLEERLLLSPEAPIVLLRQKSALLDPQSTIVASVAPNNPYLGVMLPYTPLHHLLLHEFSLPVVATSGNLSDEPICTDEREALTRLHGIADFFLVHNRPIARQVDDSICRVLLGREMILRRARGYAPLPIHLKQNTAAVLAVGSHLKNAIAVALGPEVFFSQHIGDLQTAPAYFAFRNVCRDFEKLYDTHPTKIACDLHPEYVSTKFAQQHAALSQQGNVEKNGEPFSSATKPQHASIAVVPVQHHYAHVLSCMAENELDAPVLGVAWDGAGYGSDGTIWGGEFLRITPTAFERVAHLRRFALPGGETAMKEPRRAALGLLYQIYGKEVFLKDELAPVRSFSSTERRILQNMLTGKLNAPSTSSMGRLFDAVAALVGLRQVSQFEGQAAMELEFAAMGMTCDASYSFQIAASETSNNPNTQSTPQTGSIDWAPMVREILCEVQRGTALGLISAKFHHTLVEVIVAVAQRMQEERVVLTGGCFQNAYLLERAVRRLREAGFCPHWHQRVPTNDGGIALGQVLAATRRRTQVKAETLPN